VVAEFEMNEVWKPIPGHEGEYEVSTAGRVKRLARSRILYNGGVANWRDHFLSAAVHGGGYQFVVLYKNGVRKARQVHELVLTTFVSARPEKHQGAHLNGTKTDNRLDNLQWKTASANEADKRKHGTWKQSYMLPELRKLLKPLLNIQMGEHCAN
jgi:NUMOD4 motif/HNH endonuclease